MYGKAKLGTTLMIVVIVSMLFTNKSQAQEIIPGIRLKGVMGYFMTGGNKLDIKSLNSRLKNNGHSNISDEFISIGGGGHVIINKVIIGGEGHWLIGKEETGGGYNNSINSGYGLLNLGYLIYSTPKLRVYPLIGLGGGGSRLKIAEKETSRSFDDVLDNPKRRTELFTGSFLLNLAIGTDYLLKLTENEMGEGGLVFGIRAGYTFSPLKGDWYQGSTELSGAPEMGITGPYLRLMIGFGGIAK